MKVLIKPKVTKPWSKEMYDYNDKVADMMKNNIIKSINKNKKLFNYENLTVNSIKISLLEYAPIELV